MLDSKITWSENNNELKTGSNNLSVLSGVNKITWFVKDSIDNILEYPTITANIDWMDEVNIDDLIVIENWVLKILSNDYFREINYLDLKKILLIKIEEYKVDKLEDIKYIDISEFNTDEFKYLKEIFYNIIWNNFPFLEVSRLSEWSKVVDITFLWIKNLNDDISKEFVDLFINKLKLFFHKNFNKNNIQKGIKWRIIRDNYKHITFSMSKEDDISKILFSEFHNKNALIEYIFNSLSEKELKWVLSNSKISDIQTIKHILLTEFNFWIWSTIVWKTIENNNIQNKMEAFYKAEISSRNKVELNNIWENINFDFNRIKDLSDKALKLEKAIILKFRYKKFNFNGSNFDVIVNWKINNILLKYVRKGESIWEPELFGMVEEYINTLTYGFDFIAPIINDVQLKSIDFIDRQLEDWIIQIDLIQNTYKKTLWVDALKIKAKWKKWLRIFIDIVDMWIMNLNDFRQLSLWVNKWNIDENNIWKLLKSWDTATNRFQNLVHEIRNIYPNSEIALWWDEIFIFIEWKTTEQSQNIISNISKKLKKEDLVWRVSSSNNNENENIYDYLDMITSINKFFEKKIEKIISNNSNVKVKKVDNLWDIKLLKDFKWFTSINLDIDIKIQELISKNLSNFLINLKRAIDYNMVKAIIIWKRDKYKLNYQWFNIEIKKINNSELIISIK